MFNAIMVLIFATLYAILFFGGIGLFCYITEQTFEESEGINNEH